MGQGLIEQRDALAARIDHDKRELRAAAVELGTLLRSRVSLRARVASRPVPWLVGSFCLGLLLGMRR